MRITLKASLAPGMPTERLHRKWHAWAMRSRFKPMKRVARMVNSHLHKILTYYTHCVTDAVSEGINSAIQSIKKRAVPVRQWVCSLPYQLRYLLGYDRKLCAAVLHAIEFEVMAGYKRRAKKHLGLRSVALAHPGAVTFVQRFDSALRLNVHPHILALDGVYLRDIDSGELRFHPLPEPTQDEMTEVARRIAGRIEKELRKAGRWLDDEHDGASTRFDALRRAS